MSAPRRLLLLRHGQTSWNLLTRMQGHSDIALDDVGLAQAVAAAPAVAALRPAVLVTSDLTRARQTAEPLAEATGLPLHVDPRLRELRLGVREGLTRAEFEALAPQEFARFAAGHYDAVTGAEPLDDVRARMRAALTGPDGLLSRLADGELGVAVTHGGVTRLAVADLLGWPPDAYRSLRGLGNCSWTILEEHPRDPHDLRLVAYGRHP